MLNLLQKKRHKKLVEVERRQQPVAGGEAGGGGGGEGGPGPMDLDDDRAIEEEAAMFRDDDEVRRPRLRAPRGRGCKRNGRSREDRGASAGLALRRSIGLLPCGSGAASTYYDTYPLSCNPMSLDGSRSGRPRDAVTILILQPGTVVAFSAPSRPVAAQGSQQRAAPRTANPALDLGADQGDALGGGYGLLHNTARDEAVSGAAMGPGGLKPFRSAWCWQRRSSCAAGPCIGCLLSWALHAPHVLEPATAYALTRFFVLWAQHNSCKTTGQRPGLQVLVT
jgi:hypothetical protein